jgi:uncharacterized repeat protein (TIGR03803 family)
MSSKSFQLTLPALVLCLSSPWAAYGQNSTLTVLYTFTGAADGGIPTTGAALIEDKEGNLYGPTSKGGDPSCEYASPPPSGCGVVFKVTATGKESVLYTATGSNGEIPNGLKQDGAGNLYGTAGLGGEYGDGLVFKLSPTGTQTILHSFRDTARGYHPDGALIPDSSGNLYGATLHGGGTAGSYGVVFKLSPAGVYTVLHAFQGSPNDGAFPDSNLIIDSSGNLYGTTEEGGAGDNGTVFKVSPSGAVTLLHSFESSGIDGQSPESGVIMDSAGNLFGVTPQGGTSGQGVVYKISNTGTFTDLYNFTGGADGGNPIGSLGYIQSSGFVAGTAAYGGSTTSNCAIGCGLVFAVSATTPGKELVLYTFTGLADGANPESGILAFPTGGVYNLFGTTISGGLVGGCFGEGCGTVFKLAVTP